MIHSYVDNLAYGRGSSWESNNSGRLAKRRNGMKRTRLVLGCVVLQLIWLIVANEALAAEEYLPMAKGMEWVMDLEATSPQGDKTNGVARRRIEQKVEQDGKGYLRSHTWVEGDRPFAMDYTKLVRKEKNGLYSIDERDPKLMERREIVLPFKVGSKWEMPMGAVKINNVVVAKEDVKIGQKVYKDCFRIRSSWDTGEYIEEFWEAPGIGSVKSVIKTKGGTIVLTLKEFKRSE
jgi:hypothetical protein